MRSVSSLFALVLVLVHLGPIRVSAQTCDDFEECTVNDMCGAEECSGTPITSGSCDDFNPCTVDDRCTETGCMGDPAPVGTSCAGGCGTCEQLFPIPGLPLFCTPKPDIQGQACTADGELGENLCAGAVCQVLGGVVPLCGSSFRQCPDTDGIACTDVCNPATGECIAGASTCIPGCEICNTQVGACQPANLGTACDDFDPCTTASSCQELIGRGFCMAGTPSAASPTPTAGVATATQTRTVPPTPPPPTATRTAQLPTATNTERVPTPTGAISTPTSSLQTTTPTNAVSTATPGGPTATATAGGGTATPTMSGGTACVGDCNRNGEVRINELVLGVNIALGQGSLAQCTAFDPNNDQRVAINELVQGTRNALQGCQLPG